MDPERSSRFTEVKDAIVRNPEATRSTAILVGYSAASVFFLLLFHLLMARYLGPQGYSIIGVFTSILLTVILMSSTIYLVITRFITYHHTRYQYEEINYLVTNALKYFFAAGFLIFLIFLVFSGQIAVFFQVGDVRPVVMLGFAIWLQLMMPVYEAAFKGLEDVHSMGRLRIIENASRWIIGLIIAYFLVNLVSPGDSYTAITYMVFALGLGTFVALSTSYASIRGLQRRHMVAPNMQEIWAYARPAILMTATIALLLNMDVILVKHFFPPSEAGVYAAASFLAKIPFLVSWVYGTVIFPRVTKLYVDGKESAHVLRQALKIMGVIVILWTLITIIFANIVFHAAYGDAYTIGNYFGVYTFAMGLLAIVNILTIYQLGLKRFTLARIIPWFLVLQIGLFLYFHDSIIQFVAISTIVSSLLVATTVFVLRHELQLEFLFNT